MTIRRAMPALRTESRIRPLTVALAAVLLVAAAVPGAAAGINWHDSYESALSAAGQSDKPILVFVYMSEQNRSASGPREQIRINREDAQGSGQRLDVVRMLQETLNAPEVVEAATQFESFKLDLLDPANDDARRQLKVSPGVDVSTDTRAAMYPLTVFLDSSGHELFRRPGSMPALGYAALLGQAAKLQAARNAVLDDPRDATKRRQLGRAYMEMDPTPEDRIYEAAVEHLQAAIQLDPQNETGANFDAQVDLAILSIPEAPEEAVGRLFELQTQGNDGHRKLEIQYYMAVAHFVMEDYASAKKLLREFETEDRNSPYWDSPWTPQALGLLEYVKQLTR